MRVKISSLMIATLLLLSTVLMVTPAQTIKPGTDFNGIHFNLNLHGVPDGVEKPVPDDSGTGRHSIFVPLNGEFELYLAQSGNEWQVQDCDATDPDNEVRIVLPSEVCVLENPDTGICEMSKPAKMYMVYVVGLSKPGDTQIVIDPEAEFQGGNTPQFNLELLTLPGHKKGGKGKGNTGKPVWMNATELFLVDVTLLIEDVEYTYEDEWVFDIEWLLNYWWDVSNSGVRLMQVRFYPIFGNGNGNGNNG